MSERLKAWAEQHGFVETFGPGYTGSIYGYWNSVAKSISGSGGFDFCSLRVDDAQEVYGRDHRDHFVVSVSNHASGTNPHVNIGYFKTLDEVLALWWLIASCDYDNWAGKWRQP